MSTNVLLEIIATVYTIAELGEMNQCRFETLLNPASSSLGYHQRKILSRVN